MNKSDFFTADAVKPHFTYDDYCESADMIASHLGDFRPEVLLVLGSGLGFLGDRVEARFESRTLASSSCSRSALR